MKRTIIFVAIIVFTGMISNSCATNKKKKCDTCPKWTSELINIKVDGLAHEA